jgi:hypothetical protein
MNPLTRPLAPLSKPLNAWFEIFKYDFVRIRQCLSDDSSPRLINMIFRHAIDHLGLGRAMISERKSPKAPSVCSSPIHFPQDTDSSKVEKFREDTRWWKKDYRFAEFVRLAKDSILEACQDQGIPLKKEAGLSAFLRSASLACKVSPTPQWRNPLGWEKFKIANELFAKSICMMIKGDHNYLSTSELRNLSHLLARLQQKLGTIDSCSSL